MKWAETHNGVLTLQQALAAGLTARQVEHRIATGRWVSLGETVYAVAGSPRSWEQRLLALVYAAGPAAAASHRSAAALLGIPGFERRTPLEVTTPRARRHRDADERVHRWRPFPDHHLTVVEGIPTTRVARTLCDLAGILHPGRTERAVDNCLAMGIVTPGTLEATFNDLASRGRKGTATMRAILADRSAGYVPPEGELEARFRDLVRTTDLPEPVRQLDVGSDQRWIGRVDLAYPTRRLLIELDSARHHTSILDRESDAARDTDLLAAGWQVERIRWDELVGDPESVLSRLRRLLSVPAA